MDIHKPSEKHVLLSLAFPLESEADKYLLYKTKTRGGMWYDLKKRLKKVMAVEEGSILNGSITPQIIDLSENNYPYWKYGGNISYPLPIEYINFLNV
jgi:CRISPR/Cas system CSM-associated protein Csm4 (group 5 of RAMP superfamily)